MNAIIINVIDTLPIITKLASAAAYLSGLYFLTMALFKLKSYSENSKRNQKIPLTAPLVYLLSGTALMYLPSTINTLAITTFGSDSPLNYNTTVVTDALYSTIIYSVVVTVGYISFIRGWFHLIGVQEGAKDHSNAIAATHIFGAILAINIQAVVEIMKNAIGF